MKISINPDADRIWLHVNAPSGLKASINLCAIDDQTIVGRAIREVAENAENITDALERARTALEYRIQHVETEGIPLAEFRRNGPVAALLREGLANDKRALETLRA